MKLILLLAIGFMAASFAEWQPDFDTAKKRARAEHKLILLNFSGSDWCGPCIRMKKEIFANDGFLALADSSLVLVNADFPRNKKNQPDKDQQQQNELLAEKYNREGKFPFTVLLSPDGIVLKTWEGFPPGDVTAFSTALKKICDAQP